MILLQNTSGKTKGPEEGVKIKEEERCCSTGVLLLVMCHLHSSTKQSGCRPTGQALSH